MGEKPYRFNLNLPRRYKEYLQEIAWQNRTTITEYLVGLVAADMERKKAPAKDDTGEPDYALLSLLNVTGSEADELINACTESSAENQMPEAARKARAEYMREWRRKNPDLVKQQRERYWARRAEKGGLTDGN